jgi:ABC-2 type transporter
MLQDLYLLELGRLAYFGPLSSTKTYFAKLGCNAPVDVNPADFYLDLVSKPPKQSNVACGDDVTWGELYTQSVFAKNFSRSMDIVVSKSNSTGNVEYTVPPSDFYRLATLIEFTFKFYTRDVG